MQFIFKAKDKKTGELKEGKVEAYDQESATKALQENGLAPMFISQEKGISHMFKDLQRAWEGGNQKDLMLFYRQLATLIGASVPIVQSLRTVAEQSDSQFMGNIIREVADDIEDGMLLSEGMSKHSDIFSNLAISVIKSGEASGSLRESLDYIVKNTEKNYKLTSKIRGALIYPAFIILVSSVVGFVAITVILPKITIMIKELNAEVPWYTSAIISLGDFMSSYWWAVLIVIFGAIGGLFYYIRTEAGKREWDHIKIEIPIFGKLFRYICLSRFASNFSILLAGGIPIVKALTIVSDVVNNSVYKSVILRAADEVKAGGNISNVFGASSHIPSIVTKMIRIGEETGKMNESLESVSSFYDEEIDNMTRNFSSLIEPVLIVVLGLGVAIMVFAILLPIYSIVDQI